MMSQGKHTLKYYTNQKYAKIQHPTKMPHAEEIDDDNYKSIDETAV